METAWKQAGVPDFFSLVSPCWCENHWLGPVHTGKVFFAVPAPCDIRNGEIASLYDIRNGEATSFIHFWCHSGQTLQGKPHPSGQGFNLDTGLDGTAQQVEDVLGFPALPLPFQPMLTFTPGFYLLMDAKMELVNIWRNWAYSISRPVLYQQFLCLPVQKYNIIYISWR